MTHKDKARHILHKYPQSKFNRGEFVICYLKEYWDSNIGITHTKLKDFLNSDWAGLERSLRDVLKEPEFKLPPKNDAKIQEKKAQFQDEYRKTLPEDEQKQYDFVFGGDDLQGADKE